MEIFVPQLHVPVWADDEEEEDGAEGAQNVAMDEVSARAEVSDGLKKLQEFNGKVLKDIWDKRKGRELLQVRWQRLRKDAQRGGHDSQEMGGSGAC